MYKIAHLLRIYKHTRILMRVIKYYVDCCLIYVVCSEYLKLITNIYKANIFRYNFLKLIFYNYFFLAEYIILVLLVFARTCACGQIHIHTHTRAHTRECAHNF